MNGKKIITLCKNKNCEMFKPYPDAWWRKMTVDCLRPKFEGEETTTLRREWCPLHDPSPKWVNPKWTMGNMDDISGGC